MYYFTLQPLQLDPSLTELTPSAIDMVAGMYGVDPTVSQLTNFDL